MQNTYTYTVEGITKFKTLNYFNKKRKPSHDINDKIDDFSVCLFECDIPLRNITHKHNK